MSMARGDEMIILRGDADDHRQIGRLEISDRALHRLQAEAGMFEVEQDEVAAGRFEDMPDAWRGELDDEVAEFRRSHPRHFLETASRHFALPFGLSSQGRSPCLPINSAAPPHRRPASAHLVEERPRQSVESVEPRRRALEARRVEHAETPAGIGASRDPDCRRLATQIREPENAPVRLAPSERRDLVGLRDASPRSDFGRSLAARPAMTWKAGYNDRPAAEL